MLNPADKWASDSVRGEREDRYCRIAVPCSLFGTVAQVFGGGDGTGKRLPPVFAIQFLKALVIFEREGEGEDSDSVKDVWRELVEQVLRYALEDADAEQGDLIIEMVRDAVKEENASLVLSSGSRLPPLMKSRSSPTNIHHSSFVPRGVWAEVWEAATVAARKVDMHWSRLVRLIQSDCIPLSIRGTELSDIWTGVARRAFELASFEDVASLSVVATLRHSVSIETLGMEGVIMALGLIFECLEEPPIVAGGSTSASIITPDDDDSILTPIFNLTVTVLEANAPTAKSMEENSPLVLLSLELIRALEAVLASSSPLLIVRRLQTLEQGLLPWLRDEQECLSDFQYNEYIASLYTCIVKVLQDVKPTADNLSALSPILTSVFTHIPPPMIAPLAFQDFWKVKFTPVSQALIDGGFEYSDELRVCLEYFIVSGEEGQSFAAGLAGVLEESIPAHLDEELVRRIHIIKTDKQY